MEKQDDAGKTFVSPASLRSSPTATHFVGLPLVGVNRGGGPTGG
jgi:hypothetical protein